MIRAIVMLGLVLLATPAPALQPDEVLADPALEARARDLGKELRCLVCRNESIDESNAELARDLRILVRERLVAGDTDQQVLDYLVARYGEYVLLRPPFSAGNAALWLAAPLMLILGAGMAFAFLRRRGGTVEPTALTEAEAARVNALMQSDEQDR